MAIAVTAKPLKRCKVLRVLEIDGPRGGLITVLLLRCGSWVTRRLREGAAPPAAVWCLNCHVRRQLRKELAPPRVGTNGVSH